MNCFSIITIIYYIIIKNFSLTSWRATLELYSAWVSRHSRVVHSAGWMRTVLIASSRRWTSSEVTTAKHFNHANCCLTSQEILNENSTRSKRIEGVHCWCSIFILIDIHLEVVSVYFGIKKHLKTGARINSFVIPKFNFEFAFCYIS